MYGQPNIPRPDLLKKADEDFIQHAASGFGGSREAASRAWFAEAERYMNQGNLDYAMRRYNQSWLLNPNNYQPYWGFGRVMLVRGKTDESVDYFERAIDLCNDPYQKVALLSDTGTAYSYKAESIASGMALEKARYFSAANQRFAESTERDPAYGTAWYRWSQSLYREGKYAEAWEKLKRSRSLNVSISNAYVRDLSQKMPEPK
jgi:tetratricopeptide (TPR) repeat protein